MYKCVFFRTSAFSLLAAGLFYISALGSAARTQGARPNTKAQVWALAEVALRWGVKVASNHGEAFRARRAIQVHANPRTG